MPGSTEVRASPVASRAANERETRDHTVVARTCPTCDEEQRLPLSLFCRERCAVCEAELCWNCACYSPERVWLCRSCAAER